MRNRVELLALIARTAERLVLWTHVYDRDVVAGKPLVAARLAAGTAAEVDGFRYALYRHEYSTDLFSRAFIGGTAPFSHWIGKDDLLAALQHFGMAVTSLDVQMDHPHGPSLTLTAVRSR